MKLDLSELVITLRLASRGDCRDNQLHKLSSDVTVHTSFGKSVWKDEE